eukprot:3322586-Rhodomonas_salina.2
MCIRDRRSRHSRAREVKPSGCQKHRLSLRLLRAHSDLIRAPSDLIRAPSDLVRARSDPIRATQLGHVSSNLARNAT